MTDQIQSFDDLYKPRAAPAGPPPPPDGTDDLPSFDAQYKTTTVPTNRTLSPFEQRYYNTADTGGGGGQPITQAPASGSIDWADIGKGVVGGLGRGTAGLIGLPGTIGGLVHSGLNYLGMPEPTLAAAANVAKFIPGVNAFTGPDAAGVQQAIENHITGKFYEPKTTLGKYASTIAEFAPAAALPIGELGVGARILNTVTGGIGSETAGQLTAGSRYAPAARFVGGVLGSVGGARLASPTAPQSAARAADVATLENAGVDLTAGARTGSRRLQTAESTAADMPLVGRFGQALQERQAASYDKAFTDQMFDRGALTAKGISEDAALPRPDVVAAGKEVLQDNYNRILGANTLRSDPQLMSDLINTSNKYDAMTLRSQRAGGASDLAEIHGDILDKLIANNGQMSGDLYKTTRERLNSRMRAAKNDPTLFDSLKDTRNALDNAMRRGLSPEDAATLANTDLRYALMKQTEGAIAKAGEHLSPAAVAQAVRAGRQGLYNTQSGALDQFARAGANVLKPIPNSGTAQRLNFQNFFNIPQLISYGLSGGGYLGSLFGWPGVAATIAAPYAVAGGIVSRPGQYLLGRNLVPQRGRDAVMQAIAQQQISLPQDYQQNQAEREQYNKRARVRVQVPVPGAPPATPY